VRSPSGPGADPKVARLQLERSNPLRFILAIILFVVALVTMGLGIAQKTFLAGPAKVTESVVVDSSTPITIIDGAALNAHDGTQTVSITGTGQMFLAYGRTSDVQAWVGDASYTELSSPTDPESTELAAETVRGTEDTVPNPAGSDLWIQEFSGDGSLSRKINTPSDVSVIIASDGTQPAPKNISITWPLDNSTPWSGPLILGGVAALLAGIIVLLWALVHARRVRGPRRKTPRMPKNPKPPRLKPPTQRRAIEAPEKVGAHGRRRLFGVVTVAAVSAVALAGCSVPGGAATSSPSPSETSVAEAADLDSPAVTEPQLKRILTRISDTLVTADEAKDKELAATRLGGAALEVRTANYVVRTNDAARTATAAIPTASIDVMLPEQNDEWPRTVFAVVSDANSPTAAPTAVMLVQDSPRDNYKLRYQISLDHDLPKVAPPAVGATRLRNDTNLLQIQPDLLAQQYGDVMLKGKDSEYFDLFSDDDTLQKALGLEFKTSRKALLQPSATVDFSNAAGADPSIAFATNDSGALVVVDLRESEDWHPLEAGAAINTEGDVKALVNKSQSTRGFVTSYSVQVLFYVPPITAENQKVQVLGFSSALVSAAEKG
jgi:hypothetical protein